MAIGRFSSAPAQNAMAEINTTPLVDVMLVLLIIFIITAPLLTHSVRVELPRAASTPTPEQRTALHVAIDADNQIFIDNEKCASDALETRFRQALAQDGGVEMHLQADRATRYETVAETMSAARRAGLAKIGFVTQPAAAAAATRNAH